MISRKELYERAEIYTRVILGVIPKASVRWISESEEDVFLKDLYSGEYIDRSRKGVYVEDEAEQYYDYMGCRIFEFFRVFWQQRINRFLVEYLEDVDGHVSVFT